MVRSLKMIWKIFSAGLEDLLIEADSFDDAIKIARQINIRYCGGQVVTKSINLGCSKITVSCSNCKNLKIVNNSDVYAVCNKNGIVFRPFEKDTRTYSCPNNECR